MSIRYIILAMRPKQWTKNFAIFAAILFSQNIFNIEAVFITLAAFFIFCLASGVVYILNDLMDIEEDKRHPKKRLRPLASGNLSVGAARAAGVIIGALTLLGAFMIGKNFAVVTIAYLLVQIAYSTYIKHVVILDVFSIAAGFFLRVVAGAEAIMVPISAWLVVCTFFLALFLALCKRRHEILLLDDQAGAHRKVLDEYSILLIDQMITVMTAATVIVYTLYTLSPETVEKFGTNNLMYTVPFVLYGVYRYLYLVYQKEDGGSPEQLLIGDKPLLLNIFLYGIAVVAILYI